MIPERRQPSSEYLIYAIYGLLMVCEVIVSVFNRRFADPR